MSDAPQKPDGGIDILKLLEDTAQQYPTTPPAPAARPEPAQAAAPPPPPVPAHMVPQPQIVNTAQAQASYILDMKKPIRNKWTRSQIIIVTIALIAGLAVTIYAIIQFMNSDLGAGLSGYTTYPKGQLHQATLNEKVRFYITYNPQSQTVPCHYVLTDPPAPSLQIIVDCNISVNPPTSKTNGWFYGQVVNRSYSFDTMRIVVDRFEPDN